METTYTLLKPGPIHFSFVMQKASTKTKTSLSQVEIKVAKKAYLKQIKSGRWQDSTRTVDQF